MNNNASACEGLNQLASASASDDDEASEQLLAALASTEPFPINLAWIVPLLSYKHISSLTTHLKRHFEQDEHFQKYSSGGARTHTYKISIYCFREICQYARHSQRRLLAQYWIKVIDDVAGGQFKKETSKLKYKKIKGTTARKYANAAAHAATASKGEDEEDEENEEDDFDEENISVDDEYSYPFPLSRSNSNTNSNSHISASNNESDDGDIESKSSSLLSLLSSTPHHPPKSAPPNNNLGAASPLNVNALYNYSMPATSPPKPRVRRDFTSVSILSRKRKGFDDPTWKSEEEEANKDSSSARPNLRLLSELALGLR